MASMGDAPIVIKKVKKVTGGGHQGVSHVQTLTVVVAGRQARGRPAGCSDGGVRQWTAVIGGVYDRNVASVVALPQPARPDQLDAPATRETGK